MIVDLYAGAGGWDEGARLAGAGPVVGIDKWLDACRTGQAAGHPRICADVATYPTAPFTGRARGVLGSPPCTPFSSAGKGLGKLDQPHVHALVDMFAAGDRSAEYAWAWSVWADPLSHHAAQPVRWIRDTEPDWVCLEQVPGVLPLWRHIGRVLSGWGYSVWVGKLCAADYGVPQTRTRAFLIASRSRKVGPPPPTHYDPRRGTALFGTPWVSMAQALGWTGELDRRTNSKAAGGAMMPTVTVPTERPAPTLTGKAGGQWVLETEQRSETAAGRVPHLVEMDRPAPTVVANADAWELHPAADRPARTVCGDRSPRWAYGPGDSYRTGWTLDTPHRTKVNDRTRPRTLDEPAHTIAFGHADMRWVLRNNSQDNACERGLDEPAPTLFFGQRMNDVSWVARRPATTVAGDPRIPAPGHRDRAGGERQHADSIRVGIVEAAILQSFRPDYPWQGNQTSQFTQVGNAVPPLLAEAVIRAALP